MRRLLILIFLAGIAPARADMGSATVNVVDDFTSQRDYDAWCGNDKVDCKVEFTNGRLSVDGSPGISRNQVVSVYKRTYCSLKFSIGGGDGCTNGYGVKFIGLMDKEFQFIYISKSGIESRSLITFRHQRTSEEFERDVENWSGQPLKPIRAD